MQIKLVGYSDRKSGIYEGISYDNIKLHLISDSFADITGWGCSEVKVKFSEIAKILGCADDEKTIYATLNAMVNKNVNLHYAIMGKFPQLIGITVEK